MEICSSKQGHFFEIRRFRYTVVISFTIIFTVLLCRLTTAVRQSWGASVCFVLSETLKGGLLPSPAGARTARLVQITSYCFTSARKQGQTSYCFTSARKQGQTSQKIQSCGATTGDGSR